MSGRLISTFELGRAVAKVIESQFEVKVGFFNSTLQKFLATYANYVGN